MQAFRDTCIALMDAKSLCKLSNVFILRTPQRMNLYLQASIKTSEIIFISMQEKCYGLQVLEIGFRPSILVLPMVDRALALVTYLCRIAKTCMKLQIVKLKSSQNRCLSSVMTSSLVLIFFHYQAVSSLTLC